MKNVNVGQMVVFENHGRVVGVVKSVYTPEMRDGSLGQLTAIVDLGFGGGSYVGHVAEFVEPTESEIAAFNRENAEVVAMVTRGNQMMQNLDKCEAAAEREDGGMK